MVSFKSIVLTMLLGLTQLWSGVSEVSDECALEIAKSLNNQLWLLEFYRVNEQVTLANITEICGGTPDELFCSYDYSKYENELQQICELNVKGRYIENDRQLLCATPDGSRTLIDEIKHFPQCVGASCTEQEIVETINEAHSKSKQDAEARGYVCKVESVVEDREGNIFSSSFGITTTVAAIVTGFVLSMMG